LPQGVTTGNGQRVTDNKELRPRFSKRRLTYLALGILLLGPAQIVLARSVAENKQLARAQFETAERLYQELTNHPLAQRTPQEYQRVIDAYRRVYFLAPGSSKADTSVITAADLLEERGRRFNDSKVLHSAIAQYEFLRREYPGSKYRIYAAFTICRIYQEDLNDRAQAKTALEEFLKRYPHSQYGNNARAALKALQQPPAEAEKKGSLKEVSSRQTASEEPVKATDKPEKKNGKESEREAAPKPSGLPLVLGIRHWSTPDYTRVAIDLESQVEYQAGRVANPDRIFFDLHSTKLAAGLSGKSFDVQDGFLRKIRVAQYQKDVSRVVLEVDDVSDYSAFLLPNPSRLIIDIHGRQTEHKSPPPAKTGGTTALAAATPVETTGAQSAAAKPAPATPISGTKSTATNKSTRAAEAGSQQLAAKAAESTPAPSKPEDSKSPAANAPLSEVAASQSANSGSQKLSKDRAPAKIMPSAPTVSKSNTEAKAPAESTKASAGASPAEAQNGKSDGTAEASEPVVLAHLDPPDLKPSKPTTAPTYESVAPRTGPLTGKRHRPVNDTAGHEARPAADGQRTLIRALGLKIGRIVVDAGHGGHDMGTTGPGGLLEKDLTLDVALRLGKLLESKLGAEVIYTRDDDSFVPLETRTAIANQNQADLFISIHANSSKEPSARGVETYYLNFTSSADALEVAARENAVSETSIHELQDLVKKIALKEKIGESHEFAADVQRSLWGGLGAKTPALRNRGVKKAPFIVLIGANMPSVLVEISFLSNPIDERRLKLPEYRQRVAEYLYRGITHYASGLSGVKVAQKR
jgi:N-acetylmuramoyl-L-alanine amidase